MIRCTENPTHREFFKEGSFHVTYNDEGESTGVYIPGWADVNDYMELYCETCGALAEEAEEE